MGKVILMLAAFALVLCGCKTIEGGYEANKDKQNAKTDKLMNEDQ